MTGSQRAELARLVLGGTVHAALYSAVACATAIATFKLAIRFGGL